MTDSLNITLPAVFTGDTWDGLTWTVSDVSADDTEFSAVLASSRFQLQDSTGTAALTLSSATSGQVTLNDTSANAWSVTVEPRVLSVAAGTYSFGLELTDADGIIKTHLAGTIKVTADPVA